MNYLMLGGGKYSARWGYSANISEVHQVIPTCDNCLVKQKRNGPDFNDTSDNANKCTSCTNWEMCGNYPMLRTRPPGKFPQDTILDVNQSIEPFELHYKLLKDAVKLANEKLTDGIWSNEEAKQYLWVFGINNDAVTKIIEHTTNQRLFAYAETHKDSIPVEYEVMRCHKERYPTKYGPWLYPASWTCRIQLNQHVDVPMHLLFLAVTKSTIKRIMEWTRYQNKQNHYLRMVGGVLETVAKLHLDWCVAIPMQSSKFGGWVSENFLALARLSRWFFSMLPYLRPGPEYRDPLRPLSMWTVKELRDWLRARGLSTHGKKWN